MALADDGKVFRSNAQLLGEELYRFVFHLILLQHHQESVEYIISRRIVFSHISHLGRESIAKGEKCRFQ